VVLFFGMKTHNASISTQRYRYRYPFYITLTWYGRFAKKLREEIEYFRSKRALTLHIECGSGFGRSRQTKKLAK
jgi:hypothetical protein